MSRYTGPRVKVLRALGVDLPGLTCKSQERRPYAPGQHGPNRRLKLSEYGVRVRETKKLRMNYGVTERYLRRVVTEAHSGKSIATLKVIELLDRRLDNIVFRAGFSRTIPAARQLVCHGHVLVDGRRVDVPSFRVRRGQTVSLKNAERPLPDERFPPPDWLDVKRDERTAHLRELPDGVPQFELDLKLVIEHYSTRL